MLCVPPLPHTDLQYKPGIRMRLASNIGSVRLHQEPNRDTFFAICLLWTDSHAYDRNLRNHPAFYHPFFCQQFSPGLRAFPLV
jgi:hypothetical protein